MIRKFFNWLTGSGNDDDSTDDGSLNVDISAVRVSGPDRQSKKMRYGDLRSHAGVRTATPGEELPSLWVYEEPEFASHTALEHTDDIEVSVLELNTHPRSSRDFKDVDIERVAYAEGGGPEQSDTVWKRCVNSIVQLELPADSEVVPKPGFGIDDEGIDKHWPSDRKYRTDKAFVRAIYKFNRDNIGHVVGHPVPESAEIEGVSFHDRRYRYRVGTYATPKDEFDESEQQCASGIHFLPSLSGAANFQQDIHAGNVGYRIQDIQGKLGL